MQAGERLHLIGSIPLASSEEVFRTLSKELGAYFGRIPDGETGERSRWVYFQGQKLRAHPDMEIDPTVPLYPFVQWDGKVVREIAQVRFKPGVDPDKVAFDTGYDKAAAASYEVFTRLRDAGAIAKGTRFQVSLPTPHSSGYLYVSGPARQAYFRVYERALLTALANIVKAIPAADLAIQWDVCQEVLAFEGYFKDRPADYKKQTFDMLGRLGDAVPAAVEMGYHLCYGSPADEHLVQPKDSAVLVEMMEGIAAATTRSIDFFHIPVPKERTDEAFYAPLEKWKRPVGTKLYLGLLHHDDETGDRTRVAVAKKFLSDFGLSAECGWGRTEPGRLPGLLKGHRAAAEAF
ncbi:MAG: hypothetical protein J0J01_09140 [Reyranella sp.]|uniref:hypothetical protein n=1 Tax=Reyranella sp. TaxID=1929291 RepID=UPI001AC27A8C|nr:hypothetical protein [Reyranella sp.]MBN9087059.1 hypothetical protein [Reyranella sp.]